VRVKDGTLRAWLIDQQIVERVIPIDGCAPLAASDQLRAQVDGRAE
jgi:hypothetical protein